MIQPNKYEKKNLISWDNSFIIYIAFAFLCAILWNKFYLGYEFIGAPDFISAIYPKDEYSTYLRSYNPNINGGVITSYLMAMLPIWIVYRVLNEIGISSSVTTIIIICSLIAIAGISFHSYLKYKIKIDCYRKRTIIVSSSLLYCASPYVSVLLLNGHVPALLIYSLAPLYLLGVDRYLDGIKNIYFTCTYFFILGAISSAGFANIGVLYVLIIVIGIYLLALLLLGCNKRKIIITIVALITSVVFANLWWITPYLNSINDIIAISNLSVTSSLESAAFASKDASLLNIFIGIPESIMAIPDLIGHRLYSNKLLQFFTLSIYFLILYYVTRKKSSKQLNTFLISLLLIIFLLKGVNEPFKIIFEYLYQNILGFQVLRRPVGKLYGYYILFFLISSTIALCMLMDSWKKSKLICRLILMTWVIYALSMVYIFSQNKFGFQGFNLPKYYQDINQSLKSDKKLERILIMPGLYEVNTRIKYEKNYNGIDPILTVIQSPYIMPDHSSKSMDISYSNIVNGYEKSIIDKDYKNFCRYAKALGISDIILRGDIIDYKYPLEKIDYSLRNNKNIEYYSKYGDEENYIVKYKIKKECAGYIAHGAPSKIFSGYSINTEELNRVYLRTNFSNLWELYKYKECSNCETNYIKSTLWILSFIYDEKIESLKIKENNFSNKWLIDNNYKYNEKKLDKYEFSLIYSNDYYVIIGFLLSIIYLFIILIYNKKNE